MSNNARNSSKQNNSSNSGFWSGLSTVTQIFICGSGLLLIYSLISWCFWDELRTLSSTSIYDEEATESISDTIRNLSIIYGSFTGLLIAVWRGATAQSEAELSEGQLEVAEKQKALADQQLDLANSQLRASRAQSYTLTTQASALTNQAEALNRRAEASESQAEALNRRAEASESQARASNRRAEASESQARASNRRARATEQQAQALKNLLGVFEDQTAVARQSLLFERIRQGIQSLSHEDGLVRAEGIFALGDLADDSPDECGKQVMMVLCAYLRNPIIEPAQQHTAMGRWDGQDHNPELPEDIQTAIQIVGNEERIRRIYGNEDPQPDGTIRHNLRGAYLCGADIKEAFLNHVDLTGAKLTNARLHDAKLVNSKLRFAHMSEASLREADLSKADFSFANLTAVDLSEAILDGTTFRGAKMLGSRIASPANGENRNGRNAMFAETSRTWEDLDDKSRSDEKSSE